MAAVATADRRFFVYDANREGVSGRTQPVASTRLGFTPTDISVVDGGFAVLGTAGGTATVHLFDRQAKELWAATVPFAVTSPPVDAGAGRVYLVGDGIAAVEQGKVVWALRSSAHVFATSLQDGSVLVAVGPDLRSVTREGSISRSLRVSEGDALVAPPAVAADGTVWVATAKALYVAR